MGKNKFVEAGRIDFADREDFGEDVLEAVVDLDKVLKILPYEEIEGLFQSGGSEAPEKAQEGLAEPEKKGRTVVRGTGTKKPVPPEQESPEEDALQGLEKKAKTTAKPPADEPSTDDDRAADVPEDDEECIACDGTGKTTKGKTCPICDGTGKNEPAAQEEDHGTKPKAKAKPEPEEEQPEEQQEDKPARRVVRR